MFIPNTTCKLQRASKARDIRGERTYARAVDVPCAVVSMNLEIDKTSVRADSSGSRGRAEEIQGVARILFPAYVKIDELDIVQIHRETLEVVQVNPRANVLGRIDHLEVDLRRSEAP